VLVSLLATVASIIAGVLLTLAGAARPAILLPLRSFAMAALLASVLLHLLPDAVAQGGGWILVVFAAGLVFPNVASAISHRRKPKLHDHDHRPDDKHRLLVWIFGIGGVLLHQFGDGVALGSFASGTHAGHVHWDLVVGIAAHTVPLVAIVTLGLPSKRAALYVATSMVVAAALGMATADVGGMSLATSALPWLNAAVAGLLLHILAHDTPMVNRTSTVRTTETIAVIVGFALPLLLTHDDGEQHYANIGDHVWRLLLSVSPVLMLGFVVTIAISRFTPPLRLRTTASNSTLQNISNGLRFGLLFPQCSCSSLETTKTLLQRGAGAATAVAFLLATPELGFDTLLLTNHFFGWQVATIRIATALVASIAAAFIVGKTVRSTTSPLATLSLARTTWLEAIDEAVIHRMPWILAGIVIAAFVSFALAGQRIDFVSHPWLQVAAVMAISIPSFVCAAASTPIAATLVVHGLAPGAALAGLVVGAMANLATAKFLRAQFGWKITLAILFAAIAVVATVATIVTNTSVPFATADAHGISWLQWTCVGLLVALLVRSLWRFGLVAWLEPIVGTDHAHHHQHEFDQACGDGCHHDGDTPPQPVVAAFSQPLRSSILTNIDREH
jgi:uncharacterized protein